MEEWEKMSEEQKAKFEEEQKLKRQQRYEDNLVKIQE